MSKQSSMLRDDQIQVLQQMGINLWQLRETQENISAPQTRTIRKIEEQVPIADTNLLKAGNISPVSADMEVTAINSLGALKNQVENCTQCVLSQSRKNTVFGSGPDQADWLFIGEAPGQQEEVKGEPFSGRASQLLTQMIRALGMVRNNVYIANVIKCRPPDNRNPSAEEMVACEPYLMQQIKLINPKVIIAMGQISAQALLKQDESLGQTRGKVYQYGPNDIPLVVTYHPAYLLRKPQDKRKSWVDLLLAYKQLN